MSTTFLANTLRQPSSKRSSAERQQKQQAPLNGMEDKQLKLAGVKGTSMQQPGSPVGGQADQGLMLRPPAELLRMLQDSEHACQILSLQHFLEELQMGSQDYAGTKGMHQRMTLHGCTDAAMPDKALPLSAPTSTTKLHAVKADGMLSPASEPLLETGLDVPATPPTPHSAMDRAAPVRTWTCSDRGVPSSPSYHGDSSGTSLAHALSCSPFESVHAMDDHMSGCSTDSLHGRMSLTRTASGPELEPSNDGRAPLVLHTPASPSLPTSTSTTDAEPHTAASGPTSHQQQSQQHLVVDVQHTGAGEAGEAGPPSTSRQVTNLVAMWERQISARSFRASLSRASMSRLSHCLPSDGLKGPLASSQIASSHWIPDLEEDEMYEIGPSYEIAELMEEEEEEQGSEVEEEWEMEGVWQQDDVSSVAETDSEQLDGWDWASVASSVPWVVMGALAAVPVLLQPQF